MIGFRRAALLAGVAAVALVVVAGALGAFRAPSPPTSGAHAEAIAAELRCPTCQALSVADSSSSAAREIRAQIAEMLAEGRSPEQVRQHFVDRYGEWILLAPSAPLPWLVPFAAVALGAAALVAWLRRGASRPPQAAAEPSAAPSAAPAAAPAAARYRERIREGVEALDA